MFNLELQFGSLQEFLQMGIYTFHVWSVYSLFAIFFAYNLLMPYWQRRRFIRQQQQSRRRQAAMASKGGGSRAQEAR